MEQWLSRCWDSTQTTKRRCHVTRPPAAPPCIYHLSHVERWHLFILPGPRLRNPLLSNTRLTCNTNVQYAAPSGTVQLHISAVMICNVTQMDMKEGCVTSLFWFVDGVGERLRRHRHVDPAVWKRGEAVSSLLAGRRIWCLPHLRGMPARNKAEITKLWCCEV